MKCSFCNKEIKEDEQYITGGLKDTFMCYDCVNLLFGKYKPFILNNNINNNECNENSKLLTPSQIKCELDKYIVGQEDAKRTMATAIYNHYLRIGQNNDDVDIEKSNICLIGPTGTGKCVCSDTKIKIRNKKTGQIIYDTIENICNNYGFKEHIFIKK